MKIFRHLSPRLKNITRDSILAIGMFDGLHLGHQRILKTVLRQARQQGCRSGVLTFFPHPDRVLNHQPVLLIQTTEQKLEYFRQLGLDYCLLLSLDRKLAGMSGREFVERVLKKTLQVREVVVGRNFRFGRHRLCGVRELKNFGSKLGIKILDLNPVRKSGQKISSSLIRRYLEKGEVEKAWKLLGKPYEITGLVVKGRGLGRKLGFPTINLKTKNEILPAGVFLSLVKTGKRILPAVSNIGFRPTFGSKKPSVEAHLLDFSGRLYNRSVSLYLLKKLRDEKRFPDHQALRRQIEKDVSWARRLFSSARILSQLNLDF